MTCGAVSCVVILFGVQAVSGVNYKDAEDFLPRLYHMDDYDRCLARPGALYCMGSFRLSPNTTAPHHKFDVIKKYSSNYYAFDRTLLHRGYCVTSRCAGAGFNISSPDDQAQRFEECVQKWARPHQLTARLETLHYCRGAEQWRLEAREAQKEDSPHQLLLKILYTILLLNFVGTVYDLMQRDDANKNKLLLAWSIRGNWRRLVADYDADERLTALNPVQSVRVVLLLLVILSHAGQIHYVLYTYNPEYLEQMVTHPVIEVIIHGATVIQWFVMTSSFLLAYNLLLLSERNQLQLAMLPKFIMVRIARISPVYIVVLLFASSWWPMMRDGPNWQLVVKRESDICKRKFWSHVFFVNNFVEPDKHCLIQNWFLAVDMQLYIVAAVITLAIAQYKWRPLPLLGKLFTASCLLNAGLAYAFNWKSLLSITTPENLNSFYRHDQASFSGLYISPWGSLPACVLGLYVAHRHYYEQVDGKKIKHSWLLHLVYRTSLLLITACIILGKYLNERTHPVLSALCVGFERPALTVIAAAVLYGFCKRFEGWLHPMMTWLGFRILARMSLSVLMLHWCINMLVVAARPHLDFTRAYDTLVEGLGVWVHTYILAVPLTLLLEMPVYRTFCNVISSK